MVRKRDRGKGVGTKLWDARLKYLGGRNLAIDAVEPRVESNKKKGFVHLAHDLALYVGQVDRKKVGSGECDGVEFVKYTEDALSELVAYDATVHQVGRPIFLKQFLKPNISSAWMAKRSGRIIGYGSIQTVLGNGDSKMQHVGPVFADEVDVARALFNRLLTLVPEDHAVTMDVPLKCDLGQEVVKTHGLGRELNCTRMYNRGLVQFPMEKVFAHTTPDVSLM